MKVNKIYVVAALHGDEVFGLKVLAHLRAHGDSRIITHVGHVEAIAKRKRFIQSDLNRSFRCDMSATIEARIAKGIIGDINAHKPDVIIDLHTSRAEVGKVAITPSVTPELTGLAQCLGMNQVVCMPHEIVSLSLIGQYPKSSLSLEFGKGYRSDAHARAIAIHIIALLGTEVGLSRVALPTYAVTRKIGLNEAANEELKNYTFSHALQGYPFLVGKNTYTEFRGFLAKKL